MVKFGVTHVEAKLLPAVAEIQGATEVAHRKILRLLARARLPEDSSTHTTSREERLYTFYAPESKEDAKANAVLACAILGEVRDDPEANFRTVSADLKGLPLSLVQRMFLARGVKIPALDGRGLRLEFELMMKHHLFDANNKNKLTELRLKMRAERLAELADRSKRTSATPSVDSLSEAKLFENIFGIR